MKSFSTMPRAFQSRPFNRMATAPLVLALWMLTAAAGCGGNQGSLEEPEPQFVERSLLVRATAYNTTPAQTQGDPDEAAWGDTLRPGMQAIAISPDLLQAGLRPGTAVRIEGLSGSFQVIDKTAAGKRGQIDIYMGRNVREAREWGVREVRITWLEPVSADTDPLDGGANTGPRQEGAR